MTSDWEIHVACRYRGNWAATHHTTESDISFPLTIWACNRRRPDGEWLQNLLNLEEEQREQVPTSEGSVGLNDTTESSIVETSLVAPGQN